MNTKQRNLALGTASCVFAALSQLDRGFVTTHSCSGAINGSSADGGGSPGLCFAFPVEVLR